MGRPFLAAAGAAGGALAPRRALEVDRARTPTGPGARDGGRWRAAQDSAAEVGVGTAEREHQRRVALEVDTGARDPVDAAAARELLEEPSAPRPPRR